MTEIIKFKKFGKFVANWYDKAEYIINIWNLKQALNHRLILKKVSRLIKFNQKTWLKQSINTKLRQKAKHNFVKDFFKLINSAVFKKTMGNVKKHRNIKLQNTGKRRNHLVSERNYHTTKFFTENSLTIEMRKTLILINKPVYFGYQY